MMRALLVATALLFLPALAGCLSDSDPANDDLSLDDAGNFLAEVPADRVAAITEDLSHVIDPDHGGAVELHAVPELHQGAQGLEVVGYNPLTRATEGSTPLDWDSGYAAIDTWQHLVCVAHFAGTTGATGGATIVDISDPAEPVVLSSISAAIVNSDCQFTDDGRFLLLATYINPFADQSELDDAPISEAAIGVAVYDVSDPANPVYLTSSREGDNGDAYHNVFTANIEGTNYIFQTYTGNILALADDGMSMQIVGELEHSSHDFWVGQHPISGDWVAVTGAGYGTAVFNINDPTSPVLLGVWEGIREKRLAGWHRQWPVDGTVDGRAYMVVAGEECGNGDSLPYAVLDWTDPTAMELTGSWWIPGKPANPGRGVGDVSAHLCEMNSHEFEVWNGYVATGNYHAGVWLFDVGSPERTVEPATIGYFLPTNVPQMEMGTVNTPFVWSPNTWGAYFDERGYVITADWHSGLYVLEFDGTTGLVDEETIDE